MDKELPDATYVVMISENLAEFKTQVDTVVVQDPERKLRPMYLIDVPEMAFWR